MTRHPSNGTAITDTSLDDLGPVDYLVVELPAGASNFTGGMAAELLALVDSGTIRVIDSLILTQGRGRHRTDPHPGDHRLHRGR
jgi:hypothetical protein